MGALISSIKNKSKRNKSSNNTQAEQNLTAQDLINAEIAQQQLENRLFIYPDSVFRGMLNIKQLINDGFDKNEILQRVTLLHTKTVEEGNKAEKYWIEIIYLLNLGASLHVQDLRSNAGATCYDVIIAKTEVAKLLKIATFAGNLGFKAAEVELFHAAGHKCCLSKRLADIDLFLRHCDTLLDSDLLHSKDSYLQKTFWQKALASSSVELVDYFSAIGYAASQDELLSAIREMFSDGGSFEHILYLLQNYKGAASALKAVMGEFGISSLNDCYSYCEWFINRAGSVQYYKVKKAICEEWQEFDQLKATGELEEYPDDLLIS